MINCFPSELPRTPFPPTKCNHEIILSYGCLSVIVTVISVESNALPLGILSVRASFSFTSVISTFYIYPALFVVIFD